MRDYYKTFTAFVDFWYYVPVPSDLVCRRQVNFSEKERNVTIFKIRLSGVLAEDIIAQPLKIYTIRCYSLQYTFTNPHVTQAS